MRVFFSKRILESKLDLATAWLIESLAEGKGRQQLFEKQAPQLLDSLREMALIESAESSNRIEGVMVEPGRLRPLVIGNQKPRDRSEEEIVGYRKALNWIHTRHERIGITSKTILALHGLAQGGTSGDAGQWKTKANDIIEIKPDGRRLVRFKPMEPGLVPQAMDDLCLAHGHVIEQGLVPPLLAAACLVLDFLCIHPFRDGNGRVSRLLTLLTLYHAGYEVGRYISLERLIEESKEDYYETLKVGSTNWHEDRHDVMPWFRYLLSTWRQAYREFEDRASNFSPARGTKTAMVESSLAAMQGPFGISDIERLCPHVSRETVRNVMNSWREQGKLVMLGRGREAKWRPKD